MMGKVPSFSLGSTESSTLPGYLILCLALQGHRLASAQFTVTGPSQPITVYLGKEAILPCYLSPRMSAENMEVRWFRSQFSQVVHLYRDGQDQYGEQMLEYQGRTELLKDDISIGNVSLRIRNIRTSDEGQYKCFFQSDVFFEEALLELKVAGLGSAPAISVDGHQDGGIRVVCRSSGWYTKPEMLWKDPQGQLLLSASETISQGANGLFQTEIANVLTEKSNQKVSCCVRNPQLNQEMESEIYIAELFFPRRSPWMRALCLILALLTVLILLASYFFWRQHREKETLPHDMEIEKETLRSNMEKQKEALRSEMERQKGEYEALKQLGPARVRKYAVDVTLDPATANSNLVLSEDRKHVRCQFADWMLLWGYGLFVKHCVLGAEGFTRGKHYWEVEVGDKSQWYLGVCRESASRDERATLSPENGHWVMSLIDGEYMALTSHETRLPVSIRPRQVGIFLDYEAGEVSFYNVTDRSHLFTFTNTFSGTLRPYFCPCDTTRGKNTTPLIICPVPAQSGGNLCS